MSLMKGREEKQLSGVLVNHIDIIRAESDAEAKSLPGDATCYVLSMLMLRR